MRREDFQFDQFCGAGQELRGLQDGAVLCGRAVYREQVIPGVKGSTSEGKPYEHIELVKLLFNTFSVILKCVGWERGVHLNKSYANLCSVLH